MKTINKMKWFTLGVIITILFSIFIVPAVAASITKTVDVTYNDIKISLDGTTITPTDANGNTVEPFIIDGTTYLPVRAISNALGLDVGWDSETSTVLLSTSDYTDTSGFDESSIAEQVVVTDEYSWSTTYSNYIAIVIKNTSDYTIQPRIQLSLKDSSGAVVGAKNKTDYALGPNNELVFIFSNDESFSSYDYVISASEAKYYNDGVSNLEMTVSTTNEKVILEVTNSGSEPVMFVEYTILYFYNGQVVDYGWGYCVDDDSEIKPGMTEIDEDTTYNTFDSVEVYLTGYCSK